VECTVALLDREAGNDADLVARLADLINAVYAVAEAGLWQDGAKRTTTAALAADIRAGEIAVATRGGEIVGCIRIFDRSEDTSEFGILVAAPNRRGTGVGRTLVDFAEQISRERGRRAIRLELLVPHARSHPSKEFLKGWYGRRGYRLVRTRSFDEAYPEVAPLLASPCDLETREKPLR
jgi:GNAT superfamily N-acetyltransferase